ncbi:HyaD/HybD family hydrogenase maturation endopeptidase [Rhabdochromatium marinum]|uniref:HyaD/HybD family hydrogenase maturation endopeptidase n=1 Tax=Rhabdochromatium marinum TaxID=48729 RepID=UPI00308413DF
MSTPTSDPSPTAAPTAKPDALIIGLGNLLLSDEGVGIHSLRRLEQHYGFTPEVELVDGGTTGLDLLELFRQHDYILLLDALFAPEGAPGDIQILRNDAILTALSKKLSMHHLGISDVLALAQLLDYRPREIVLLGVIPEHLELGTELSPAVAQRMPDILANIQAILGDWQIAMHLRESSSETPSPTGAALFVSAGG